MFYFIKRCVYDYMIFLKVKMVQGVPTPERASPALRNEQFLFFRQPDFPSNHFLLSRSLGGVDPVKAVFSGLVQQNTPIDFAEC